MNDPSLLSVHYLFLIFHYCSCLISVLVSLQSQLVCCSVVTTNVRRYLNTDNLYPFNVRRYRRIVRRYPNGKIRVLKTCYPYGTKFGGLIFIIYFVCFCLITKLLEFICSSVFSNQNWVVSTCFSCVVVRLSSHT